MLWHGASNGAFDLRKIVMETLTSMTRAGKHALIAYYTEYSVKTRCHPATGIAILEGSSQFVS